MYRLAHWFYNGKGFGLKYFLLFSLFCGLIIAGVTYMIQTNLNTQGIADLPLIVIENGHITTPKDTNVSIEIVKHSPVIFSLNTTAEPSQIIAPGFYVTSDNLTIIQDINNPASWATQPIAQLTEDIQILPTEIIERINAGYFLAIFIFIVLWVCWAASFGTLVLFFIISGIRFSHKIKGRVLTFSWISLGLINVVMTLLGRPLDLTYFCGLVLLLSIVIVFKMQKSIQATQPTDIQLPVVIDEKDSADEILPAEEEKITVVAQKTKKTTRKRSSKKTQQNKKEKKA